jgi:hypothetical protein
VELNINRILSSNSLNFIGSSADLKVDNVEIKNADYLSCQRIFEIEKVAKIVNVNL